jgi:hypothetical protein
VAELADHTVIAEGRIFHLEQLLAVVEHLETAALEKLARELRLRRRERRL